MGARVMDRHNLTVQEQPGQEDLAEFLAANQVEVVASMPCYLPDNVEKQRGKGVYDGSIRGRRRLNAVGYGRDDTGLTLNLVYNPVGASLPPPQAALEADYKRELGGRFGIVFNSLFTLANMPIQRFGAILLSQGQFDAYLDRLLHAHRDEKLETDARALAQREMTQAAKDGHLLERAGDSARHTVEQLLRSLGFTTVDVKIKSP
jgi:radical SAM/Cys-rich protein